jgi:LPXTG-site transpeptidase (sortase) family protein
MKLFSNLLIIFGLLWCLLAGYYFWMRNDTNALAFQNYKVEKTVAPKKQIASPQSQPQRIVIKGAGIDLPLIPSKIDNDKWETTNAGASYLTSSPIPGTEGNSIIYAHNWATLFGKLVSVKPGEQVEVLYADGSKKRFTVEYTSTVTPTTASILAPTTDKRITMYTCTGFLDSKRFVVVAVYEDIPSFASVARN